MREFTKETDPLRIPFRRKLFQKGFTGNNLLLTCNSNNIALFTTPWRCLCALFVLRAMLAGASSPGRFNQARQVKDEKPDQDSETNLYIL